MGGLPRESQMSRKLKVTELENRIAPTVYTTIGDLLAMLPAGAKLPSNFKQVGNLSPSTPIAVSDATWAAFQNALRKR